MAREVQESSLSQTSEQSWLDYTKRDCVFPLSESLSLSHTHTPLHFEGCLQLHSLLLFLPQETELEGKIKQECRLVHSHRPELKSSTLSGRKKRKNKAKTVCTSNRIRTCLHSKSLWGKKKNNFPRANKGKYRECMHTKISDFQS